MKVEYMAVTKQEGGWWVGWIEEVPGVNCQERTQGELLESLRVTLQEALEFNREEALKAAGQNYREEKIAGMKQSDLLRHLRANGCALLREGARHSWWHNPSQNKRSAVPRHTEIRDDILALKICKDLGVLTREVACQVVQNSDL